jgi:hypothetical protein
MPLCTVHHHLHSCIYVAYSPYEITQATWIYIDFASVSMPLPRSGLFDVAPLARNAAWDVRAIAVRLTSSHDDIRPSPARARAAATGNDDIVAAA